MRPPLGLLAVPPCGLAEDLLLVKGYNVFHTGTRPLAFPSVLIGPDRPPSGELLGPGGRPKGLGNLILRGVVHRLTEVAESPRGGGTRAQGEQQQGPSATRHQHPFPPMLDGLPDHTHNRATL